MASKNIESNEPVSGVHDRSEVGAPRAIFDWYSEKDLYAFVEKRVNDILADHRRAVISITGFSGAGKTYTAESLLHHLRKQISSGDGAVLDTAFINEKDAWKAHKALSQANTSDPFVSHFCQDRTMYPNIGDHRKKLVSSVEEWLPRIHNRMFLYEYMTKQYIAGGKGDVHHLREAYAGTKTKDGGHHIIPPDQNVLVVSGHDSRSLIRHFYPPEQTIELMVFREPQKMYQSLSLRDYQQGKLGDTEDEIMERMRFRRDEGACQVEYYGKTLTEMMTRFPEATIINKTGLPMEDKLPEEVIQARKEALNEQRERMKKLLFIPENQEVA